MSVYPESVYWIIHLPWDEMNSWKCFWLIIFWSCPSQWCIMLDFKDFFLIIKVICVMLFLCYLWCVCDQSVFIVNICICRYKRINESHSHCTSSMKWCNPDNITSHNIRDERFIRWKFYLNFYLAVLTIFGPLSRGLPHWLVNHCVSIISSWRSLTAELKKSCVSLADVGAALHSVCPLITF